MKNLRSNLFVFLLLMVLVSCKSQAALEIHSFDSKGETKDLQVVTLNSKSIVQKCIFLNAEDENQWRHDYVMYILNEHQEVIPVMSSLHLAKSVCKEQIKKIKKILNKYQQVKLCLRGKIKAESTSNEFVDFGKQGKPPIKYESLIFDSICSTNDCYSVNEAWTETCPGFKKLP